MSGHFYVFNDEQLEQAIERFVADDQALAADAEGESADRFKADVRRFLLSPHAEKLRAKTVSMPKPDPTDGLTPPAAPAAAAVAA